MTIPFRSLLACAGLTLASLVQAQGAWTFSAGVDHSSGKYGDSGHTETLTLPLGIKYEAQPWTLRLTVPYVVMRGPANVVASGGDRIALQGRNSGHRQAEGPGDVVAGAAWTAWQEAGWLVDFGAKAKFATGDADQGLSTGENDYSLYVDVYRKLGSGTIFGTLGKRWMGDPAGSDLANPLYGTLGWSQRLTPATSAGLTYDYREKLQATGAPVREATVFVSHRFGDAWKVQGYVVTGFSAASPDLGGGILVFYSP